ncbi:MAG: N-acetylmuramoyl-L-alanine amidase [Lachnospiraceae bacterium]|nr:N-acetylmuramoyl-L-alanine amidase [Lachnospiraceae bacterium]
MPRSRGSNKIEFIVVHYLGVPNADNPNLYGGGYGGHYNIKRDGSVYKAADPKTAVVWHCGGGLQGSGGHSFHGICTNFNSIGIECGVCYTDTSVKDASGDSDQWYFTTETQESLVWLVSKLMDEYGINFDHVIRHYDVTGKICPNPYVKNNKLRTSWTWEEFKSRLAEYRKSGGYTAEDTSTTASVTADAWYRVRKNWGDAASQVGAFKVLDNAKACADEHPGYYVFDPDGKKVYTPKASVVVPFLVRVKIRDLNIRTGPGTDHAKTGQYTGIGVFTIVEVADGKGSDAGWGKLKSGAGWCSLDYCQKI